MIGCLFSIRKERCCMLKIKIIKPAAIFFIDWLKCHSVSCDNLTSAIIIDEIDEPLRDINEEKV